MVKIYKDKPNNSYKKLKEFLHDNNPNKILIRGFCWDLNLSIVLKALKQTSLNKGLLTCVGSGNVSKLFHRAGFEDVNASIGGYTIVNGLSINFDKYNEVHNDRHKDFHIFFPVENMLLDKKEANIVIDAINKSHAQKTIVIITNDFYRQPEELYPYIDIVQIVDISNYNKTFNDRKLSQIQKNVELNLKARGEELPY